MGNIPEEVLLALAVKGGGGGGGGTSNYEDLENKPQIGGVTLIGNKTASDLGLVAAETGKGLSTNDYTDADKAIVGGVTAALAGKQNALTAGDYISINASNEISVNRELTPHQTSYRIKGTGRDTMNITKYIDGVQESSTDYTYSQGTTRTIDDAFTINDTYSSAGYIWQFVWLKDSTTHDKDYTVEYRSYEGAFDFTEVFNDEDLSGYKLVIKSEMDTALADKADKSAVKNEFIGTTAEWNALTTAQKKAYDTYQITDDYTEGSGGLPDYSTTEQKTGQKWIDGKDIYFRVLELQSAVTLNSNQWINLGVDIPISTGIQAYAIASDGTNVPICLAYDSTVGVQVLSMRTASIAFSTFILYYTKTA